MLDAKPIAQLGDPLPTPPVLSGGAPLLGHMLEFYRDQEQFFRRGYREHGDVFAVKFAGQPVAILVGPENHDFFFSHTDKELDMEAPYGFLAAMFGKIAFLGNHETYLLHRPVLHSLFGRQQMVDYLEVMSRAVAEWVDGLGESGEIDITFAMQELVKEVAGRCFLGDAAHARLEAAGFWEEYDILSKSLDPLLYKLPLPKFIRRDQAKRRIGEILRPLIDERRAQPQDDGFQRLLEQPDASGKPLPEDIVANFFSAILFAGHETTAGQAAWSLIQLAEHPEVLENVRAEVDEVLAGDRVVDHIKLRDLRLVDAAVKETGRMHPSAETLIRGVKQDVQLGGYRIPKGWFVMTSTAAAHFIPGLFQDPFAYDPTRFLERKEGKANEYISFGGGMHKCTGMNFANAEMAIITALLFQRYEIELITPIDKVGVSRSGSSRPTKALIRYRRRPS